MRRHETAEVDRENVGGVVCRSVSDWSRQLRKTAASD